MKSDNMKECILNVAKHEFLQNGFHETSLRYLAKQCNTSTGTIYGYFKSKESIFSALTENRIQDLMDTRNNKYFVSDKEFVSLIKTNEIDKIKILCYREKSMFLKLLYRHRNSFMLLLLNSKGTHFEDYWEQLFQKDLERGILYYQVIKGYPPDKVTKKTMEFISKNFLQSLLDIFKEQKTYKMALPYLKYMYTIYWMGFLSIMDFKPELS